MTLDLETRLRQASDSLRSASDALDPSRPSRHRRRLLMIAVLLLVAVGAGAAFVALRDRDREPTTVTTDSPSVQPLVPDAMPDGLAATGAVDLPLASDGSGYRASVTIYGDPDAEDPLAAPYLAVTVNQTIGSDDADDVMYDEEVRVRDRPGGFGDDPQFGSTLGWLESDDTIVRISSPSLRREELLAAAEGLTLDGTDVSLDAAAAGLGSRLDEVASIPELSLAFGWPIPLSSPGHVVGYQTGGDVDEMQTLQVMTFAGDSAAVLVLRWMLEADQPTEIRSHDGWASERTRDSGLSTDNDGNETIYRSTSRAFIWEEMPGVVVAVIGDDMSESDMRSTVESLRNPTDEEWSELLRMSDAQGGDDTGRVAESSRGSRGSASAEVESEVEPPPT